MPIDDLGFTIVIIIINLRLNVSLAGPGFFDSGDGLVA